MTTESEDKPRRRRRRQSATDADEAAPEQQGAAEQPVSEGAAKPRRRRQRSQAAATSKQAAETAAEDAPKPRRRRKQSSATEAGDEAAEKQDGATESNAEESPKPLRRRRQSKAKDASDVAAETKEDATESATQPTPKTRRRRKQSSTAAASDEAAEKQADATASATEPAPTTRQQRKKPPASDASEQPAENQDDAPETDQAGAPGPSQRRTQPQSAASDSRPAGETETTVVVAAEDASSRDLATARSETGATTSETIERDGNEPDHGDADKSAHNVEDHDDSSTTRQLATRAPDDTDPNDGDTPDNPLPTAETTRTGELATVVLTAIVIPTYNEAENIAAMCEALLALDVPTPGIIIVDDNSPDGTGAIASDLAAEHAGRLIVLHRAGKEGLGTAYVEGFKAALETPVQAIVQMDCDFSHPPDVVPPMVSRLDHADIVVASRYCPGGGVDPAWSDARACLSRGANMGIRLLMGLMVFDATSGFKAFQRFALEEAVDLDSLELTGFGFQAEVAYRMQIAGLRATELPYTFMERTAGKSKMSAEIAAEALWRLTKLRLGL